MEGRLNLASFSDHIEPNTRDVDKQKGTLQVFCIGQYEYASRAANAVRVYSWIRLIHRNTVFAPRTPEPTPSSNSNGNLGIYNTLSFSHLLSS